MQLIGDILKRGVAKGVFRRGLDPVELYITHRGAVGYFYFSNNWTLSAIFGRALGTDAACRKRKRHNVDDHPRTQSAPERPRVDGMMDRCHS